MKIKKKIVLAGNPWSEEGTPHKTKQGLKLTENK